MGKATTGDNLLSWINPILESQLINKYGIGTKFFTIVTALAGTFLQGTWSPRILTTSKYCMLEASTVLYGVQ